MEIYLIILFAVVGAVLGFMFSGHKCPHCGKRSSVIDSSEWVNTTPKKSDGSDDFRHKKTGYFNHTVLCQNPSCKRSFKVKDYSKVPSQESLVELSRAESKAKNSAEEFQRTVDARIKKMQTDRAKAEVKDENEVNTNLKDPILTEYEDWFQKNKLEPVKGPISISELGGEEVNRLGVKIENAYNYYFHEGCIKRAKLNSQNYEEVLKHKIIPQIGFLYFVDHKGNIGRVKDDGEGLKKQIIALLEEKGKRISITDINKLLNFNDRQAVKKSCEKLHQEKRIEFSENGKYYTNNGKKSESEANNELGFEKKLTDLKGLYEKELITKEDYDKKKKEIIGL